MSKAGAILSARIKSELKELSEIVGKYKLSSAMRFFFLGSSAIIWAGIGLTGFSSVHWLLYLPAVMFAFAAISGICPGMIFSSMLFKDKKSHAQ